MSMNRKKHQNRIKSKKVIIGEEELCCPVCELSLARHPNPKPEAIQGNGLDATEMRNEIRAIQNGKIRESDLIVAAICGHLFHRFCLRHYCYVYQQANSSEKVECPVCFRKICMAKYQNVDYKSHLKYSSKFAQELKQSTFINEELMGRKNEILGNLNEMEEKIVEAKLKLETYRNHQKNLIAKAMSTNKAVQERDALYKGVEDCNKGIDAMYRENIGVMKMYLTVMKDQPREFLRGKRIPPPLIPYLAIILADDNLLRKFAEIIKPVQVDGITSNADLLIEEILAEVEPKAKKHNQELESLVSDGHLRVLKPAAKPVVVKVKRSSVSIFTRSELDENSLKTIMRQVDGPINSLKDAHDRFKSNKNKSNPKKIRKSASDILVLWELRRKKRKDNNNENCSGGIKLEEEDVKVHVPPRRCKSTDAVLMKNTKTKKAMLISMEGIKKIECNALGDGLQSQKLDRVKSFHSDALKIASRQPSQKLKIQPILLKNYESVESQTHEVMATELNNKAAVQRQFSTAGFKPHLNSGSGSVLEMIYEEIHETTNSMSSLVDDVSKITFQKKLCCQDLEDNGSTLVKKPIIEYNVSISPDKVTTSTNTDLVQCSSATTIMKIGESDDPEDIESGLKLSELNVKHQNQRAERKTSGLLQGILPGPFLIPSNSSKACVNPVIDSKKTPVYQSKWLNKLPSMKAVNVQSQLSTLSLSRCNCSYVCPPPNTIMTTSNAMTAEENWSVVTTNANRNQPFGDMQESAAYSSCKVLSPRHTVINIPSSNTIITFTSPRHSNSNSGQPGLFQPTHYHGYPQNLQICHPRPSWSTFVLPDEISHPVYSVQESTDSISSNDHCHEMTIHMNSMKNEPPPSPSMSNDWNIINSPYSAPQCNGDFSVRAPLEYSDNKYDEIHFNFSPSLPQDLYHSNGPYNNDPNHGFSPSSPRTRIDSGVVEHALVELCRGLSPPRNQSSYDMQRHLRRNGYIDDQYPLTESNSAPQHSNIVILPDGSQRTFRRARRRHTDNVTV